MTQYTPILPQAPQPLAAPTLQSLGQLTPLFRHSETFLCSENTEPMWRTLFRGLWCQPPGKRPKVQGQAVQSQGTGAEWEGALCPI